MSENFRQYAKMPLSDNFTEITEQESKERPALIIFTTGSTSEPKAVLLSQYGMLTSNMVQPQVVPDLDKRSSCIAVPLFHCMALLTTFNMLVNGRPVGRRGKATRHNAMPLMNLVFNHEGYFWNGSVCPQNANGHRSIEDIVLMAIEADDELCSTEARTLAALRLLRDKPLYTIPVIAEEAGFSSVRTLQRRIQEAIGMSPIDYRLIFTRDS